MASEGDENIQLNSEFTYQQYAPPIIPQNINISGSVTTGVVTTINGNAGSSTTGPVVTITGGSTGLTFTTGGASITLTGTLDIAHGGTSSTTVEGALAALGLSKNNVDIVGPGFNDDDTQGYSINSIWTDTNSTISYICQDASTGAAIWTQIAP